MPTPASALPDLTFEQSVLLMKTLLGQQPPRGKRISIGIVLADGRCLTIDSTAANVVSEEPVPDAALSVITTERTLSRVLTGALTPQTVTDDDVFAYGGDLGQWTALGAAVGGFNRLTVRLPKETR